MQPVTSREELHPLASPTSASSSRYGSFGKQKKKKNEGNDDDDLQSIETLEEGEMDRGASSDTDEKKLRLYDGDVGSLSDTGVYDPLEKVTLQTQYKRTRRAFHLKSADLSRLRETMKYKREPRRSISLEEEGELIHQEEETQRPGEFYRLSSFCTCDSFALSPIIDFLESSTSFRSTLTLYTDVLYVKMKKKQWDIFVFSYGCVAFFNVPQEEEEAFLRSLRPYESLPLPKREMEEFEFTYGTRSLVRNDEITLSSRSALEKLSVAFAIAQCCKLSIFEQRIHHKIEQNKHLPEALARDGKIGLSQKEITMKIGSLFIERNSVNLHCDILDTPEFFWEQDKYKPVYDRLSNYLELSKRVDILNKRLDIMKELFDMLNDQMASLHANKLEWIVIWLIVVEVVISVVWQMLIKDILHLFPGGSD